ncbi:MAG TPA: Hint domain-containing protein [Polyangiaceae bacterium]|nr:Hint domain-containing protein [Polyangiaceae bacterium]
MKHTVGLVGLALLAGLCNCGRTELLVDDNASDGDNSTFGGEQDAGLDGTSSNPPSSGGGAEGGGRLPDGAVRTPPAADAAPGIDGRAPTPGDASGPGEIDAGGPRGVDAGEIDAVAPPPTTGARGPVTCGATTCTGGAQECCIRIAGFGAGAAASCVAAGECQGGLPLTCSSSANCARGEVCCLGFNGNGATCATTCGGRGAPPGLELCTTNAQCAAGDVCQAALFGVRVCVPGGLGRGGRGGGGGGFGGGGAGGGGIGGGGVGGGRGGGGGGGGPGRCASPDTPIATPGGERPISDIRAGDVVYSVDHDAIRPVVVLRVGRVAVTRHHVVRVRLASGRSLEISAPHPTADGRAFRDLQAGGLLDGEPIESVEVVPYDHDATYDILPASDTRTYFAAGVRIGSTLDPAGPEGD